MSQKRILTIQDVSCFGKCSETVALPVLSAAGHEAVMLPTALLSTHTGGFKGFTFLDLTDEMTKIADHWIACGITFDCLYTGYFGSREQLKLVRDREEMLLREGALRMIDPVLGDRGAKYLIYDDAYVEAMRSFCVGADVITPNVTEACLLTGTEYAGEDYDPERTGALLTALGRLGVRAAAVTGLRFGADEIGVAVREYGSGRDFTVSSHRVDAVLHGTGDVFASALVGYLMQGADLRTAVTKTIAFLSACIEDTAAALPGHWYGVLFEKRLGMMGE